MFDYFCSTFSSFLPLIPYFAATRRAIAVSSVFSSCPLTACLFPFVEKNHRANLTAPLDCTYPTTAMQAVEIFFVSLPLRFCFPFIFIFKAIDCLRKKILGAWYGKGQMGYYFILKYLTVKAGERKKKKSTEWHRQRLGRAITVASEEFCVAEKRRTASLGATRR